MDAVGQSGLKDEFEAELRCLSLNKILCSLLDFSRVFTLGFLSCVFPLVFSPVLSLVAECVPMFRAA